MDINTQKVASFFGDFKTIWIGFALIIAGAAWAGDQRWLTLAEADTITLKIEINTLQQRIEELNIQKSFEDDQKKKDMLQALIDNKESRIQTLKALSSK